MKKKYNPFKMWGSYAGAIVPTLFVYSKWIFTSGIFLSEGNLCHSIITGNSAITGTSCNPLSGIFGLALVGFLIGWGIHSFFRKIK